MWAFSIPLETANLFSKMTEPAYASIAKKERHNFLIFFSNLGIISLVRFCLYDRCEIKSYYCFQFFFILLLGKLSIFSCLLSIWVFVSTWIIIFSMINVYIYLSYMLVF